MAADGAKPPVLQAFGNAKVVCQGWYWAAASRALRIKQVLGLELMGRSIVLYRGVDGVARARDAFCPHMGAHLSLGRVEGNGLRCFFHGWRFDQAARCDHVPALDGEARPQVQLRSHPLVEKDGLIWIWVGDGSPSVPAPHHPQLDECERAHFVAAQWTKGCHPNVVLINAIDEHHFRTVHAMPGEALAFVTASISPLQFRVTNTAAPPAINLFWRLISQLYPDRVLAYEINYFSGATGTVSFGPAWMRMHLMFATRLGPNGQSEGVTVALTKRRTGVFGWLLTPVVLGLSALGGAYFALGDTKVFNTIRFDLKTPIPADKTVMAFVRHVEAQPRAAGWRS
ncbi:MAG: Rieske 2Fe-2S domain-containing protein [Caulobacterales bacterium]